VSTAWHGRTSSISLRSAAGSTFEPIGQGYGLEPVFVGKLRFNDS